VRRNPQKLEPKEEQGNRSLKPPAFPFVYTFTGPKGKAGFAAGSKLRGATSGGGRKCY
jgi:hypothetical protein